MTQAPERKRHDEPAASKALLFDYRKAANPVRPGLTDPIPYRSWGPELHQQGPTGILPLDLSAELGVPGPATSPALAAHFIRIEAGEGVRAAAEVTSSLFFVQSGSGVCQTRAAHGSRAICLSCPPAALLCWKQAAPAFCIGCTMGLCSTIWG